MISALEVICSNYSNTKIEVVGAAFRKGVVAPDSNRNRMGLGSSDSERGCLDKSEEGLVRYLYIDKQRTD